MGWFTSLSGGMKIAIIVAIVLAALWYFKK